MKHASDSSAQRDAEQFLIDDLNQKEKLELLPQRLPMSDGATVQLDGIDIKKRCLCEVFAHIGKLKSAQSRKVTSDMLKLLLVEKHLGGSWRKILCFANQLAAQDFQNNSWRASAVRNFSFEVFIAQPPAEIVEKITSAQDRQRMVNA